MKKILSLLLILALCLAFAACGADTTPAPTEPVYTALEITMDNWQTYFEIVSQEIWEENGFGEAEGYRVYYRFKIRDEYLDKIKQVDADLTVDIAYTANAHYATVDFATRTLTIGEIETDIGVPETGNVNMVSTTTKFNTDGVSYIDMPETSLIYWDDDNAHSIYLVEDMPTVARIKGTVQILAD